MRSVEFHAAIALDAGRDRNVGIGGDGQAQILGDQDSGVDIGVFVVLLGAMTVLAINVIDMVHVIAFIHEVAGLRSLGCDGFQLIQQNAVLLL